MMDDSIPTSSSFILSSVFSSTPVLSSSHCYSYDTLYGEVYFTWEFILDDKLDDIVHPMFSSTRSWSIYQLFALVWIGHAYLRN